MRKINKMKLDIQLFAEEQTLETTIKSKSEEALKSLDKVISKLNTLSSTLNKVNTAMKSGSIKSTSVQMDDFAKNVGKSVVNAQKLASTLSFTALTAGITRLSGLINDWVYETSDYSEQLNLFNVIFNNIEKNGKTTFSELGKSATQFQHKLNEAFGTNKIETFYMQGMFQAMGEAVNIPDKYSALMSETMTKLTYDMASLYNKQETDTAEALRAGVYAGQTKPLRSYGIDVTATSMQPILDELGIDRTVKQLSQAEKEIVRYLATLRQASNAMGDFANTIESPANQLKIFKQQLVETKVAITSLIMNLVGNMLPYLNALLMVIKEIALWLGTLLGIEFSDFNSGVANYETGLEGIGDSADKAGKAVKKLKREALGFDQIHNINENTGSSGSGSVNVGNGIDQKLLDAIYGYDNGMEKVRMKATEIRDKIMEWLGFTKQVDDVTKQVSFKLKDGYSNLKLIAGILGLIGITKLVKGISGLVSGTSTLGKLLGTGGLYTKLSKLAEPIKVLGAKDGVQYIFLSLKDTLTKVLPIIGKVAVAIGGLIALFKGASKVKDVMNIFGEKSKKQDNNKVDYDYYKGAFEGIAGGAVAGGAIGSIVPGIGTAIGALVGTIVGAVSVGISAVKGFKDGLKDLSDNTKDNFAKIQEPLENFTSKIEMIKLNESMIIDDNTKQKIISSLEALTKSIQDNIKTSKKQTIDDINSLVKDGLLSKEEAKTAKDNTNKYFERISKSTDIGEKKIKQIIDKASKEKRELTDDERQQIESIYELLKNNTISTVTTSQTEQSILLDEFANKRKNISKEVASQMIGDAVDIKNKTIEEAEKQYTETLNKAQNMKNIGAINEETYNKIKQEAQETRDKTIKDAETQYDEIYDTFAKHNEDIAGYIDRDDGHVKSSWEKFWDGVGGTVQGWFDTAEEYWQDKINKLVLWWNTKAVPWLENNIFKYFTKDYWKNKWDNAKAGFQEGIENVKTKINEKWNEIKVWFNNNVGKYFTKTYWSDKLSEIKKSFNEFTFPKIKLSVTYDTNVGKAKKAIYEALGLDGWPKLKFQAYANGGFPEDGFFYANHTELVGKFSNGKTAVANNDQIIEGIYKGVYSAVLSAMSQTQTSSQIDVHVHTDEGTVVDRINQKTKQTGVFPLNIPI